jgi:hypothetical protein
MRPQSPKTAEASGRVPQRQRWCCRLNGWQRCTPALALCCYNAFSFERRLQPRRLRLPALPPLMMKLRPAP